MAKASTTKTTPKTTKKTTNRTKQTAPKKETKLNQTFYYDRKKLVYLVIFNVFLVSFIYMIISCLSNHGYLTSKIMLTFHLLVLTLSVLALIGSTFVAIFPQRLALLTNDGITIDHNETLKWTDIDYAKEFKAHYIYPQQAIALHTKEGVTHQLTFMQKMCQNNVFTPFSIPLYAMPPKDAEKIRKIIKQKCKYKDLIK